MLSEKLAWALMFAGFIASTASQVIIKARLDPVTAAGGSYRQLFTDPLIWLAVVLILSFVVCWYTALTKIPLSVMMAWSAVVLPLDGGCGVDVFGRAARLWQSCFNRHHRSGRCGAFDILML